MVIEYSRFETVLNKKLFENGYGDLISKIAQNPDRYIGLFRPTKPKTKLIQNITQSHEIRFGDALETLFEEYFEALGCNILNKVIKTKEDKVYNIDQLFIKDGEIYLIEQKVRDDHDSTKKVGQFQNFEDKYYIVSQTYNEKITPIMWFIDDSLQKNKNYYTQQMAKMRNDYGCDVYLFYGSQLFDTSIGGIAFSSDIWSEIISHLTEWKDKLPDMPEVNFDNYAEDAFSEIRALKPSDLRKLFDNEDVIKQIFPIVFPQKIVLKKLRDYFRLKGQQIFTTLSYKIDAAMSKY